jgi:DNA-binding response OmpR family regulator
VRLLLATDRPDLGHALCLYLTEAQIDVVEVGGDTDDLLARVADEHPDAVLVHWNLGSAASSRAVADLQRRTDPTPVIILRTGQQSAPASTSGATAYVTLGDPPESLLALLADVLPAAS